MTELEGKLGRYKDPSSAHEKDKQDRAERMVRDAVDSWAQGVGLGVSYIPKGSYANNTNVRLDSDVDIAVVHGNNRYYLDASSLREGDIPPHTQPTGPHYTGVEFRTALQYELFCRFGNGCDISGKTAIELTENTSRVKADIVPSYEYRKYGYTSNGDIGYHQGHVVFRTDGTSVVNYPQQQLDNGITKNNETGTRYKQLVRIMKNIENELVSAGQVTELPSYFMECLVFNVPNDSFGHAGATPLTDDLKAVLYHIWSQTGDQGGATNWYEPNKIKRLFGGGQPWTIAEANDLCYKAWNFYGLKA